MKLSYKYKNKTHNIEIDSLSQLPTVMRERIPEINEYQNFRYSLRVEANTNSNVLFFRVAICVRDNPFNFHTFEQLYVNQHIDRFVTASQPFESFEEAVNHFNMLTEMFESETGVTLHNNNKKTIKRTNRQRKIEHL